jgi:Tfp pilus assembly protein PilX
MGKLIKSKRRGSAVALAMIAVMILLAMGVGMLTLGMSGRIYSIRTAQDIAVRCAADAGLTMALYEMNEKLKVKPWDDSSLPEATNQSLLRCSL